MRGPQGSLFRVLFLCPVLLPLLLLLSLTFSRCASTSTAQLVRSMAATGLFTSHRKSGHFASLFGDIVTARDGITGEPNLFALLALVVEEIEVHVFHSTDV